MQPSDRARELERVYQSRRGHAPQLSISDESHHVTEAIGDMYGDDQYAASRRSSRPLSFISNPLGDTLESLGGRFDPFPSTPPKSPLRAHMSNPPRDHQPPKPSPPQTAAASPTLSSIQTANSASSALGSAHSSPPGPLSPPSLSRTNSDTATQQFPLNDIDYESSPAGLAQELSNLQAIRRMSMDVHASDPDLPSFSNFSPPVTSPQHFSEDEDPSKLFWVPARLHPELAPKEFKTFIEEKVDKIRRRSGDADSLSPDGPMGRQSSSGGLRRKKSMLSKQIDSASGYRDGAERLERKRSGAHGQPNGGLEKLQELENIVEDPAGLMRRMSIDAGSRPGSEHEVPHGDDMPILPSNKLIGPGTLKRSTRTNYRRGSIRKGVPAVPRRPNLRHAETDTEESPATSPTHPMESPLGHAGLARVQSEPVNGRFDQSQSEKNFSRPTRQRSPPQHQQGPRPVSADDGSRPDSNGGVERRTSQQAKPFHSRIASNGRTTAPLPGYVPPQQQKVPQIVETPPQDSQRPAHMQLPERGSSRGPPPNNYQQQQPPRVKSPPQHSPHTPQQALRHPPAKSVSNRSDRNGSPIKPAQTFDEIAANPAPLPGNSTRTDSLSIIPNMGEEKTEKKLEKRQKEKKDSSEPRKTSWGWLLGSDDKEREKKDREDRDKELAKKVKNKLSKPQEKGHDDTRLDVLQTSISGSRGRESVVLDRDSIKLEEERKKESSRKSSGADAKKEKETGLFSSIFGGGKKKGEKESAHKKGNSSLRGLSPEPPPRILKPDIDYNWTRFSILEERAIYRMAHIKLANPRRELYSQVLLSNFMYSYLAKVQQMHPQIQIGTSKQAQHQQRQQQAAQQKKEQQPEEYSQYQRYQQSQEQAAQKEAYNQSPQHGHNDPHQEEENQYRPDSRSSHQQQQQQQQQQPRDSHHSSYGKSNGSYSVASGQNYMGHPGGGQPQQQYYGYEDSDQSSKDDDMW